LTQKIKSNESNVHFQEKVVLLSEQFFFFSTCNTLVCQVGGFFFSLYMIEKAVGTRCLFLCVENHIHM